MRVCIEPSSYLPSRTFFEMLMRCDRWVVYDGIQFSKGSRTNRTTIKTPKGLEWLTIALQGGQGRCAIDNLKVSDPDWARQHLARIYQHYLHAPYFSVYYHALKTLYGSIEKETSLSAINQHFIHGLCTLLEIDCKIYQPCERELSAILCEVNATYWVIAKDEAEHMNAQAIVQPLGIACETMTPQSIAPYAQLHPPFVQPTSIIDWLMCEGPQAVKEWKSRALV